MADLEVLRQQLQSMPDDNFSLGSVPVAQTPSHEVAPTPQVVVDTSLKLAQLKQSIAVKTNPVERAIHSSPLPESRQPFVPPVTPVNRVSEPDSSHLDDIEVGFNGFTAMDFEPAPEIASTTSSPVLPPIEPPFGNQSFAPRPAPAQELPKVAPTAPTDLEKKKSVVLEQPQPSFATQQQPQSQAQSTTLSSPKDKLSASSRTAQSSTPNPVEQAMHQRRLTIGVARDTLTIPKASFLNFFGMGKTDETVSHANLLEAKLNQRGNK